MSEAEGVSDACVEKNVVAVSPTQIWILSPATTHSKTFSKPVVFCAIGVWGVTMATEIAMMGRQRSVEMYANWYK